LEKCWCGSEVEQRTRNAQAVGSIPTTSSTFQIFGIIETTLTYFVKHWCSLDIIIISAGACDDDHELADLFHHSVLLYSNSTENIIK
jgi:hypothetical protein